MRKFGRIRSEVLNKKGLLRELTRDSSLRIHVVLNKCDVCGLDWKGFRQCEFLLLLPCSAASVLAGGRLSTRSNPSAGRLNCYWLSPAQLFLASVSLRSMNKIFVLPYISICFEMGPHLRQRRDRLFYVDATFVAPQFQHEYIRASSSLWTLCILCSCTVLSNIYTRYTEVSCQCRLLQQVMP
jgi:hypothetical protein